MLSEQGIRTNDPKFKPKGDMVKMNCLLCKNEVIGSECGEVCNDCCENECGCANCHEKQIIALKQENAVSDDDLNVLITNKLDEMVNSIQYEEEAGA